MKTIPKITTGYEFERVVRSHLPPSAVQPPREGQSPEEALQARRDATARTIGQVYEHGPLPLDAQVLAAAYYQIAQQPASTDPQVEARRAGLAQLCYLLGGPPAMGEPDLAQVVRLWTRRADEIEREAGAGIDGRTKAIVATLRREADALVRVEDEDNDEDKRISLEDHAEAARDLRDRCNMVASNLGNGAEVLTSKGVEARACCVDAAIRGLMKAAAILDAVARALRMAGEPPVRAERIVDGEAQTITIEEAIVLLQQQAAARAKPQEAAQPA